MPDPAPANNAPAPTNNANPPADSQPAPIAGKFKDVGAAIGGIAGIFTKLGHGKAEDFDGKPQEEVIGRIYSHFESELGKKAAAAKTKDGNPATDGKPPADAPIVVLPKDDAPADHPAPFKFEESTTFDGIIEKSGLKLDDVRKTLTETGTLDKAQIKAIANATHLPTSLIKGFAEGNLAIQQLGEIRRNQARTDAVGLFGGEEQMTAVLQWAKGYYPADQHELINSELGSIDTYATRIKSILFDHAQQSGTAGSRPLVNGGAGGATGAGWTDHRKMIADMDAHRARTGKEWHTDPGMVARMQKTPDHVKKGRKA